MPVALFVFCHAWRGEANSNGILWPMFSNKNLIVVVVVVAVVVVVVVVVLVVAINIHCYRCSFMYSIEFPCLVTQHRRSINQFWHANSSPHKHQSRRIPYLFVIQPILFAVVPLNIHNLRYTHWISCIYHLSWLTLTFFALYGILLAQLSSQKHTRCCGSD